MPQQFLCLLRDIENDSCKELVISDIQPEPDIFLVRKNDCIYAYHNKCPHTGVTLNWQPDQFLDISNTFIQCGTHGALFNIEDGLCVRGPCAGESLQKMPVTIQGDRVMLTRE